MSTTPRKKETLTVLLPRLKQKDMNEQFVWNLGKWIHSAPTPIYPERSPTNRTSLGQRKRKRKTSLPWPFNLILFDRCRRQHCRTELLVGSIEFRCCRDVTSTSGKMVFDGSIEKISCITQHEDYDAITNRAVLVKAAPLLRTKDGRTYRRRGGVSENEWVNTRHFVYGTSHKFLS